MDESENEGGDEEEPQRPDVGEEEEKGAGTQWKKEMEAIQRAMDEENKRAESAQVRQTGKDGEDERKYSRGKSIFYSTSAQNTWSTFESTEHLCCCQQRLKRLRPRPVTAGGSLTSWLPNSVKSTRK